MRLTSAFRNRVRKMLNHALGAPRWRLYLTRKPVRGQVKVATGVILLVKQHNNGTTLVVSPYELPWLKSDGGFLGTFELWGKRVHT